ncbi:MAG: sodium:proton antiporter [Lachnospiraceae bacterium]|nr:sodium:proton antiporter [Lachnospiraceae bacterium]
MPLLSGLLTQLKGIKKESISGPFIRASVSLEFVLSLILLISYIEDPSEKVFGIEGFAALGISFVTDGFRRLYSFIAVFMWTCAVFFSREYMGHEENKNRYYLFMMITLSSTVGVFFSADLYTLFIFFEIMSLASYVWVATNEDSGSLKAAGIYMAVAVIGGLVMLMGIFMIYSLLGTLNINDLSSAYSKALLKDPSIRGEVFIASLCLLFGFGAKAGAFPLHIWLPKAHPVAPAPASALLSGILTKAGVFGILILSCKMNQGDGVWGSFILVTGTLTMFTGALLAIFSIDLKRTLACSSVSQIGFILVGVGMYGLLGEEGNTAINGALMHMINHSLFKLVLFLAAGVVFMNIHELELNKIRGFGRNKLLLKTVFLLGSLGIMGIPLFSGYASKTLIHEAIVEYYELIADKSLPVIYLSQGLVRFIEWIFLLSGGCTIAYMLKLFVAVFVEKNSDRSLQERYDSMRGSYISGMSRVTLILPSVFFILFGILPGLFGKVALTGSSFLGNKEMNINYFSLNNLRGSLISIVIGLLIYFGIIRNLLMWESECSEEKIYVDLWPEWLDLCELIYRPLLMRVLPAVFGFLCRILDCIVDYLIILLRKTVLKDSEIPRERPEGTAYTSFLGRAADKFVMVMNRTLLRKRPMKVKDHAHLLALRREGIMENEFIILRSMSFGLSLFCLGLMVTVIYMLIAAYF